MFETGHTPVVVFNWVIVFRNTDHKKGMYCYKEVIQTGNSCIRKLKTPTMMRAFIFIKDCCAHDCCLRLWFFTSEKDVVDVFKGFIDVSLGLKMSQFDCQGWQIYTLAPVRTSFPDTKIRSTIFGFVIL